jgi:hypothetical protein
MNKLEVCIGKLKAEVSAAEEGGAHMIKPLRLPVAREVLRQLEVKGGGANDSATGGAQPQSERILQQPPLEHPQQDSQAHPYNGPRALAVNGYTQG